MLSINTNITSLLAMKSLNKNTNAMDIAMNRLSTGFRINSSKDDAAGSAISASLSKEISSFDVAQDNAQMGQSMIDTASSTISNIQNMVQRIRDLAVESANGTYGDEERKAMQNEVSSLLDEVYRIKETTEFNGKKLFGTNSVGRLTEETAEAMGYTVVKTAEQLKTALQTLDAKVMLFDDIDLDDLGTVDGNNWTAVGREAAKFTGTLDGNGFTISNLKINKTATSFQGLFGYTDGATISNVNLKNADVTGCNRVGALIGSSNNSKIDNCNVTGNINSTENRCGGIVGYSENSSAIENCSFTGNITGASQLGGIVGALDNSEITNCESSVNLTGTGSCGGISGNTSNKSSITNCESSGNITCTGSNVGGITAALNNSSITNCESTCDLSGYFYIGGILGQALNTSTITNCEASGDINGSKYVGGIAGYSNKSSIISSDSSANVTGTTNYVGGIAGEAVNASLLSDCNSSATVTGVGYTAGIVGSSQGAETVVEHCNFNGTVYNTQDYTGGISGTNENGATITDCSSSGTITGTRYYTGGLVGSNARGSFVTDSTANATVSGNDYVGGVVARNFGSTIDNCSTTSTVTGNLHIGAFLGQNTDESTVTENKYNPTINEGVNAIATGPSGEVTADSDLVINPPEPKAHPERGVQKADSKAQQNPDTTVKLQVGIGSDKSSNISVDTGFDLGRLVVDISTEKGATRAIGSMDKLMNELTAKQTELASASNRLQSAMEFQQVQKDSKIAMLSVIKDADIAKENSDYIKAQILQQTTASLLAQANQTPSIALRLLSI